MTEVTRGDGWAVAPDLDSMGEGYGFRKLRRELDVTEFGVNVITIPPGYSTGGHYHERQQELYFVHRGPLDRRTGGGSCSRSWWPSRRTSSTRRSARLASSAGSSGWHWSCPASPLPSGDSTTPITAAGGS